MKTEDPFGENSEPTWLGNRYVFENTESQPTRNGPFSLKTAYMVGQPGPPSSQSRRGESAAFTRAGKNQKNKF